MRVHPLVFHRVMDTVGVGGWQVVQEVDGLRVLLAGVADGQESKGIAAVIQRALAEQNVTVLSVRVERVAAIPKATSGKAPLIKALRREPTLQEAAR